MENHQKCAKQEKAFKRTADELRAQCLKIAKERGIGIVHIHREGTKGGLTIAFSKSSPYKHGVMVDVAVNTCSTNDAFSRKLGTHGALEKYLAGETIQLPLLLSAKGDVSDLNWTVKQAFTTLYNISRY